MLEKLNQLGKQKKRSEIDRQQIALVVKLSEMAVGPGEEVRTTKRLHLSGERKTLILISMRAYHSFRPRTHSPTKFVMSTKTC